jgi:hypothetical protein
MIEIDAAPYDNGSRNELYIFTTVSSNFFRRRTSRPALTAAPPEPNGEEIKARSK